MVKRLAFTLLAACMAARVHAGLFGASEKELEGLHHVGVVSLLLNTYHMVFVGTTAFSNMAYDLTGSEVGTLPDHVEINKLQEADRKKLVELARQQGFDGLIVVQQADWGDSVAGMKPGYGFYRRTFMKLDQSSPYAALAIELYRADTGKSVDKRSTPPNAAGSSALEVKPTLDAYSPEERAAMEHDIKVRMTAVLEATLKKTKWLLPE